ncbi:MAG: hypothetical protein R8G66_29545 [Cytophagales bacterium]|nr:hypothetical protein [Cytophagales bacterium]
MLLNSMMVFAQAEKEDILSIRAEYNRINSISTRRVQLENEDVLGHMTDGGATLTGYFEGDILVKAVVWVGLSYGNVEIEYYLKDSELFFGFEVERTFAKKYEEGEFIGGDYAKDLETGFEGRYYFEEGELIRDLEKGERMFGDAFDLEAFKDAAQEFFDLLRKKAEG